MGQLLPRLRRSVAQKLPAWPQLSRERSALVGNKQKCWGKLGQGFKRAGWGKLRSVDDPV